MKGFYTAISIITILLVLSNLVCGFWIYSHGPADPSSISFHIKLGAAVSVFAIASAIMLIIKR